MATRRSKRKGDTEMRYSTEEPKESKGLSQGGRIVALAELESRRRGIDDEQVELIKKHPNRFIKDIESVLQVHEVIVRTASGPHIVYAASKVLASYCVDSDGGQPAPKEK